MALRCIITIGIMAFMVNDGEIESKLVDLLIDSGLYLEYAEKFLKPEQLDNVDLEKIRALYHK